ncbi:hypothetical protein MtrunA17_Chr2g0324111 [Medicago truncatula]|uniref:Late embryogenesis abundant protein n=1 Tax=Medicago truncatula TaxID=3880 RepID=A0A072VCB9_MEDTR|nr:late embryogenesis abundant protein [Medicago truncatula]RHN75703.1 hypothetical protein MtrunA17_Chr2g0324111 [Medicago truncatula]
MANEFYVPKKYDSLNDRRGYHSHRGKKKCGFLRCCCCCICTLFLILIIIILAIALTVYFLDPKVPTYNIDNLDIKDFNIKNGIKLHTNINVVLKATNPNKYIALDYLSNEVSMAYSGSILSSGHFPPTLQHGHATTNLNVILKGDADFGPTMQLQLLKDQKMGYIPLLIMVKVPIQLVIADFFHLKKFVVRVNCSMVIDSLEPNKKPKILKKVLTYDFHL